MPWKWPKLMENVGVIFDNIDIMQIQKKYWYAATINISHFSLTSATITIAQIEVGIFEMSWYTFVPISWNFWCHKCSTLKPRYSEQVRQTLLVHYIEEFTISNMICLVNPQNGSWVLFTISRNSLFWGSLYWGLSVY